LAGRTKSVQIDIAILGKKINHNGRLKMRRDYNYYERNLIA